MFRNSENCVSSPLLLCRHLVAGISKVSLLLLPTFCPFHRSSSVKSIYHPFYITYRYRSPFRYLEKEKVRWLIFSRTKRWISNLTNTVDDGYKAHLLIEQPVLNISVWRRSQLCLLLTTPSAEWQIIIHNRALNKSFSVDGVFLFGRIAFLPTRRPRRRNVNKFRKIKSSNFLF